MQMTPGQLSVRLSVILVVIFMAFLLIGGPADAESPPPPMAEYVVASGDTLWAIASEITPEGGDVRVAIAAIREASGLTSSSIQVGQILLIPGG